MHRGDREAEARKVEGRLELVVTGLDGQLGKTPCEKMPGMIRVAQRQRKYSIWTTWYDTGLIPLDL